VPVLKYGIYIEVYSYYSGKTFLRKGSSPNPFPKTFLSKFTALQFVLPQINNAAVFCLTNCKAVNFNRRLKKKSGGPLSKRSTQINTYDFLCDHTYGSASV
ncbi:MAG: hypothetical protein IJJ57_04690, partial [Ruminococcus sp.]|nr:hypothetical protein [Ruminococcus sp.]